MNDFNKNRKNISRRSMLPILGGSLLIPFLGFGKLKNENTIPKDENIEYQTLLKRDGTTVKVKICTLKKSKIIKKDLSNKSFLNWLDRKF